MTITKATPDQRKLSKLYRLHSHSVSFFLSHTYTYNSEIRDTEETQEEKVQDILTTGKKDNSFSKN